MANHGSRSSNKTKIHILSHATARKLCERHGFRQAAQKIVDALPNRDGLGPAQVSELVHKQISEFAWGLVTSVERATATAAQVDVIPGRADQGAALREIREALENLRGIVERHWDMAEPYLGIRTAEHLGRLLSEEGALELLPAQARSGYREVSAKNSEHSLRQIKLGYLLDSGSRPLTRMIKAMKIVVRQIESRIPPGAPVKEPFEMALIVQLADHYEWALGHKAAWTAGGPFSRYCTDVFESVELDTKYSWEYLLEEGLRLHRSSFVARRRHGGHQKPHGVGVTIRKRKPRKRKLSPLLKRKGSSIQ